MSSAENRPLVFVTRKIPQSALQQLENHADLRIHPGPNPPTREELLAGVRGCHGLLSLLSDRIDQEVLDAAGEQLKVIANYAVGFNNIDVSTATERSIAVGNTPDVLTDATADIACGLILSAARCFGKGIQDVKSGGWRTWEPLGWIGRDLKGKTLGIVGMGRIGEAVARRMHFGWDMQVLYTSRSAKPDVEQTLAAKHVDLNSLLEASDVVSLHIPLTDATRDLIGPAELERMKSSAVLVNTARGEVIDQPALIEALSERSIFAAGLDVCTPEPLPLDNPLHQLDNCILLPHVGSATVDTRDAMGQRAVENLVAGLEGRPLPYPVN